MLGCDAADAGRRAEQAAELLGHAAHLLAEAGIATPPFLSADVAGATHAATALLGDDGFAAAFRRGQDGQLGADLGFTALRSVR